MSKHTHSTTPPTVASMAAEDAAKATVISTTQKIAELNNAIESAFAGNKWNELAKLSSQMVALENAQKREVAAKLEAKLVTELAEVLEAYELELADYNECRIHILHETDGMKFKLTLMDVVASACKVSSNSTAAPKTTDKNGYELDSHGLPTTESLLAKLGDVVQDEKTGTTWKAAMESAKGQKNPLYQLRIKLLKLAGY